MSMMSYPEYGFGLVFAGNEEIDKFLKATGNPDKDIYDLADEMNEKLNVIVRFYDEEMYPLQFVSAYTNETISENEPMLVFWAKKQPEPFAAVYTKESIKDEYLSYLKEWIPKDFNWETHIGYFSCVIFC